MKKLPPTLRNTEPYVAVGGVGGSGTRVVAELLIKAGVHMGAHLNGSSDNLDFTEYFKRPDWFVEFPTNDMLAAAWQAFVVSQDTGREALGDRQLWGWKEPNTHIFLPFLRDQAGGMK